jgi:hypothetical protein
MSADDFPERQAPAGGRRFRGLERVTAVVLWAVIAALGWVLLAAYQPEAARLPWLEAEVVIVLGLLTGALVLVSVVALLHTRA